MAFSSFIFIFTTIFIILSIIIEDILLYSQFRYNFLTKKFGNKAFKIHSRITGILWSLASLGIIWSMLTPYPKFHNSIPLMVFGLILLMIGLIVATLGYKELGMERSMGINFFSDNEAYSKKIETGIYKYIKNPEEHGFWLLMIGFALLTTSTFNLIYCILYIVLMIPHQKIENLPLKSESEKRENL